MKTNETDKFWDRNALYEEVWTTPMQRLAEKYGISDVGLAKVCRKLSIPRPGRGDWARIAAGQIVARTPLPKLTQEIRVWKPMPRKKLPQIEQIGNEQERLQLERLEQLPSEYVLKHGGLSHPLIAQARIVLARATEDDRHILQVREQCLDIRVSKNSLDRALRIMAGLISLIENEGFVVKVGKNSREQTTAVIHEQEIAFGIVEKAERLDAISLPSENILKKVLSYGGTDVAFHPTGQLSLEIWKPWRADPKRWKDKKNSLLEGILPRIVASFIRIALAERTERDKERAADQERQRKNKDRARLHRLIKEEKARVEALHRTTGDWIRADQLRTFIQAARDAAIENGQEVLPGTQFGDWLIWMEQQADRLDPLRESPISIIDREDDVSNYRDPYAAPEKEPRFEFPKPIWKIK